MSSCELRDCSFELTLNFVTIVLKARTERSYWELQEELKLRNLETRNYCCALNGYNLQSVDTFCIWYYHC